MHAASQHGPRPLPLFLDILWRETADDSMLRSKAFAGLRRYQTTQRPKPAPPAPVKATVGSAQLLHYGTENRRPRRSAVVFVPSLINPPAVLDLSAGRSLLRYLAEQGHDPWLIDWGTPCLNDRTLDLTGHILDRLLPLIDATGNKSPVLVGYCLGGTLTLAAAMLRPCSGVATIAAPWSFSGFPASDRAEIARLWAQAKPVCEKLGYVPMEVLQTGFWALDPKRTIRKFAEFADIETGTEAEQAFLALEDWANAGPPLTYAAAQELFEQLYNGDLTGQGGWTIGGRQIDPKTIACPTLSVRSSRDRIVPIEAAPTLAENWTVAAGHVGMVVGSRAQETLWARLGQWLASVGA